MKKFKRIISAALAAAMSITYFCALAPAGAAVTVYKNRNQYTYEYDSTGNKIGKYSFEYSTDIDSYKIYTAKYINYNGDAALQDLSIYGEYQTSATNTGGLLQTKNAHSSAHAIQNSVSISIKGTANNWQFASAVISTTTKEVTPFWIQSYVGAFE